MFYLSKILLVIILIAPSLFLANTIIDSSITGDRLVQDLEENNAGSFINYNNPNTSRILSTLNIYPISHNLNFTRNLDLTRFGTKYVGKDYKEERVDLILYSPKLQKQFIYYNLPFPTDNYDSIIYKSRNIKIIRK